MRHCDSRRRSVFLFACIVAVAALAHQSSADEANTPKAPSPKPPPGATILFNGKDLSQWTDDAGKACKWKIDDDGVMAITEGGGSAVSKLDFKAGHIHLEFNLPESGKGHGNSGVYVHRLYELQIIDSFNKNPYKPGQQCGALYLVHNPIKQMCRKPGEWQTYDIQFRGAKLDADGKLVTPATFTVWHNGELIHKDRELSRGTGGAKNKKLVESGPILLQNHGAPVRFRNVWVKVAE